MTFAPFGVLTLWRAKTRKQKKRKKRIENLATIEKPASSRKIILINQTPLPVFLVSARGCRGTMEGNVIAARGGGKNEKNTTLARHKY